MKRGRKRKQINWREVIGRKILTVKAIAKRLNMSYWATQHHIARAVAFGHLIKRRHGRINFYMLPETWEEYKDYRLNKMRRR